MAERKLLVVVAGDDRSLQRTLNRSSASVTKFGADTSKMGTSFSRGLEPLLQDVRRLKDEAADLDKQLSEVGSGNTVARAAALGAGFFALGRVVEGAGAGLEAFQGEASSTSNALNDAGKAITSLITLNPAGFFEAVGASTQRTRERLEAYNSSLRDANQESQALEQAMLAELSGLDALAEKIRDHVDALKSAQTATDAVAFAQREYNVTVLDGVSALVAFKGAVDDAAGPRGPGARAFETPAAPPPGLKTLPALSPSQRRELELITAADAAKIPLLKDRLAQLNGQLADFNGNQEQRIRLVTRAKQTEAELAAIYERQARAQRDAAEAARRASEQAARDAARRAREAAQRAREARERAAALLQSRQFRALGLSATGGEVVPGVENLRKQLGQLSERLAGSDVQSKLVNRLAGVRKLLKGQFGQLTDETRAAINELFRTIRGEFDKGTRGPLTKTSSLNANKIIAGLGLSPEDAREITARLSSFNTAGRAIGTNVRPTGNFVGAPITVESHTTVQLDGETVGRTVTRSQQKGRRRNPVQKRGGRSGI